MAVTIAATRTIRFMNKNRAEPSPGVDDHIKMIAFICRKKIILKLWPNRRIERKY